MTLREQYPLHPNKVIKKAIEYSTGLGLGMLFAAFALLAASPALSILAFLLLILSFVGIYLWSREYYKVYFYDMTVRGLEIRKGVFFPHSITIPAEKVSDVYVDQDLLDRFFGLYDLHFSSASLTSGALAHVDGLDKAAMDRLRAFLMGAFKRETTKARPAAQIAQESAPEAKTLAKFAPDPQGYWLDLGGAILTLAFVLFFLFPPLAILVIPLVPVLAFWIKKEFECIRYELRAEGLWIRRGWITPSETLLFYRNIQDIDINEPLLLRIFGLRNLVAKSMSYQSAMSAVVKYLSPSDAKKIQEMLQAQIDSSKSAPVQKATMPFAAGAGSKPAQPAKIPIQAPKETSVNPYKNQFLMGHLVGGGWLIALLVLFGAGLFLFSAIVPAFSSAALVFGILAFAFAAFLLGLAFVMAFIDEHTYSYSIGPEGLSIALGLLSRQKKVLRYEKIQDIKLYCGFFESFVGLASLHIETGSRDISSKGQGGSVNPTLTERIPSLRLSDARALQARFLQITGISYPKGQTPLRTTLPLSAKKPLKKTIGFFGLLSIQLLLICLSLAFASSNQIMSTLFWAATGILLLCMLIGAPLLYWYENLYMKKYYYDENNQTLMIRKGVFGWSEIVVPFRNIQSIYVDQDWYDVYFDLWDVWITTVTLGSGQMAHIDGIGREDAQKLARMLSSRVEKSRRN